MLIKSNCEISFNLTTLGDVEPPPSHSEKKKKRSNNHHPKPVVGSYRDIATVNFYLVHGLKSKLLFLIRSTKRFGPDEKRFEHLAFLNLAQSVVCLVWSFISEHLSNPISISFIMEYIQNGAEI